MNGFQTIYRFRIFLHHNFLWFGPDHPLIKIILLINDQFCHVKFPNCLIGFLLAFIWYFDGWIGIIDGLKIIYTHIIVYDGLGFNIPNFLFLFNHFLEHFYLHSIKCVFLLDLKLGRKPNNQAWKKQMLIIFHMIDILYIFITLKDEDGVTLLINNRFFLDSMKYKNLFQLFLDGKDIVIIFIGLIWNHVS